MSAEAFTGVLALVGLVILVSALFSGFIERSGVPQVAVFLGLGAALGPAGLGVLDVGLNSPTLRVVATLSLVLVLFTDAVSLDIGSVRRSSKLAMLVLGPGTLLSAGLIALAGWALLGLEPAAAVIVGAALASTDPVLLRGVLRQPDIPPTTRQALRLESGLNDIVLLPMVLVAMVFLEVPGSKSPLDWARLGIDLFLLGPAAGVIVGLLAVATLDLVRQRVGIRRDYESIYSIGVAFTAFAAAETVHGSGFLAAFAAGMTIAALDVELCDCFLEYGETTAEMALLFTFVIFGGSLIWSGFGIIEWLMVLFAVVVIAIRPVAFLSTFAFTKLQWRDRALIAWFGPRGLSTLLLVLLPVFDRVPGSDRLFAICTLVVILSVVLHGGSPLILARYNRDRPPPAPPPAPVEVPPAPPKRSFVPLPLLQPSEKAPALPKATALPQATPQGQTEAGVTPLPDQQGEFITLPQMQSLIAAGAPVVVLDVRTERTYLDDQFRAKGAIRVSPDSPLKAVRDQNIPKGAWLIAYCA